MTKQPSYRFGEYTEVWEEKKLGEVSEKVREKNSDNLYSSVLTNSAEFGIIPQRDFFDKDIANEKNLNGYYIVRQNDFVYNPRISNYAPVGPIKSNKLNEIGVMSPLYYVFRTHDIENSYLATYFDTTYWHKFMKINGDSGARADRFAIKDSVFVEMPIPFPSLPEQTAIGSFFQDIDQLISLQQCKLEVLKEQKKTYLKLLFPAKGQTKPALHFAGFEDEWKEVKLGEVGETYTGLSGKTKEDFGHGEGKFITYVNVFNNPLTDLYGLDSVEIDDKQRRVQYGDVLFTTSSETPEDVGLSSVWMGTEDNVYLNSFCFGYRPQKGIFDLYYLAFVLRSFSVRKEFMLLAQGISRFNISKTKVMDMSIHVPSLPEQEAIGAFFQDLDKAIAKQEEKVNQLKESKQTLLRKMFI